MSAIAGLWRAESPRERSGAEIDQMLGGLSIYGTGEPRRWCDEAVALGRWLIPTVPEDEFDLQPCAVANGRFQLVADVRLDNRPDLLARLGMAAHDGAALADSSLVALAWERWREDCFTHLIGDWAVAVWDSVDKRLHLARDPLGGRPLFFHHTPKLAAFASMPSGLHALADIPRVPDEERAEQAAIFSLDVGDRSFYAQVRVVRAGELVTLRSNDAARRAWWQFGSIKPLRLARPDDYADALRESLDRAVTSQLRRIGPAGSQLSAGLDSTCVATSAALALRSLGDGGSRLVAFTSAPRQGYDGPAPAGRIGDESALAAEVAAQFSNIDHVIVRSNGTTPFDHLDRHFTLYQQPVLNLCNQVWMDAICDEARARGIRTLLTGHLGNATISHRDSNVLGDMVAAGQTAPALREASLLVKHGYLSWRGVVAPFRSYVPGPLYGLAVRLLTGHRPYIDLSSVTLPHPRLREAQARAVSSWGRDRWARPRPGVDLRVALLRAGDVAPYTKGMLAGWQVDLRHPAIDRRVVETCLALPPREFIRGGVPASVLRRAFGSRLPASLLNERLRGAQGVDWHEAATAGRSTLAQVLTQMEGDVTAQRTLDLPRLRALADNWPSGGWEREDVTARYRMTLLRAVSLGDFLTRANRA
jgi:asparagine synthase (glutamine-hydrolysing)